ncbi:crotonase/enoyl-CoA hydratase family protein [Quisquiliibacterium transsilvanicum]|uniref:Enoyl-CoA hydratase/carnithine racemase n=1 Tax=Quisquiliibacterium transsilvanicum TaxID=1549638 RepID=A0A7W8HLH4_9BURK|nr:crotonase/enoyl-CoA hydratase family protein [Quisquiliibacterium transsilvanicum]MBB5273576.1 enoyl-CoA hydratase/carnithine racemase [Quisquiliibacterium transsilvanicum]
MTTNERVRVTVGADGVAEVRLNRPDKMNALDAAMFTGIVAAGEQVARDPRVRAVVLCGEGRAFCAGLDMGRFGNMAEGKSSTGNAADPIDRLTARSHGISNAAQQVAMVWREVPVPVIAAVHGVSFGGGFQLALGADIRFVTADLKMSVMEIKWGLVPDMAGIALMRELARNDVVRELTYSGRIFSGEEALQLGFATRVCADPYAEAMAFAREVAGRNPDAIRADKRLLNAAMAEDAAALLMAESVEQTKLIGSPNQVEAVKAQLEKRAPNFSDPVAG